MALWENPPHSISLSSVASSTDAGAGTSLSYMSAQTGVACSINTASASERDIYAQKGIVVTHTIAILASILSTVPTRDWKATTTDRSESYHVHGIRYGRAYGGIPAFVYLDCEQIL